MSSYWDSQQEFQVVRSEFGSWIPLQEKGKGRNSQLNIRKWRYSVSSILMGAARAASRLDQGLCPLFATSAHLLTMESDEQVATALRLSSESWIWWLLNLLKRQNVPGRTGMFWGQETKATCNKSLLNDSGKSWHLILSLQLVSRIKDFLLFR